MIREIERKPIKYEEYWVARIVLEENNKKEVVKEIKFTTPPTQQEIAEILMMIFSDKYFVSVVHNYRLVKEQKNE